MDARRLSKYAAMLAGVLLCAIGAVHDVVNLRSVLRALDRGDIPERLGPALVANVALSGIALIILGGFLLMVATDIGRGNRLAWRIGMAIGMFLVFAGIAAYLWQPIPTVFMFSLLGLAVAGPLLVWQKQFVN